MRKDEPPCCSFSQQKLWPQPAITQQHAATFHLESARRRCKVQSCIKNLYSHSESEFLFNIFQLVSLWLWGFVLHQHGWVTPVPARKVQTQLCAWTFGCVSKFFVFPMVEVNIRQGKELFVVSYWQLQLMLFFTLWKVTEWSLVTRKFSVISSRIHGD